VGIFVIFIVIWYIFPRFGILYIPRKIWQPCWPVFVTLLRQRRRQTLFDMVAKNRRRQERKKRKRTLLRFLLHFRTFSPFSDYFFYFFGLLLKLLLKRFGILMNISSNRLIREFWWFFNANFLNRRAAQLTKLKILTGIGENWRKSQKNFAHNIEPRAEL
jgi:hypothetical protein